MKVALPYFFHKAHVVVDNFKVTVEIFNQIECKMVVFICCSCL